MWGSRTKKRIPYFESHYGLTPSLFLVLEVEVFWSSFSRFCIISYLGRDKPPLIPANVLLAGECDAIHRKRATGDVYLHLALNNGTSFAARFHGAEESRHPFIIGNPHRRALRPLLGYNFLFPNASASVNTPSPYFSISSSQSSSQKADYIDKFQMILPKSYHCFEGRAAQLVEVSPPTVPSELVPMNFLVREVLVVFKVITHLPSENGELVGPNKLKIVVVHLPSSGSTFASLSEQLSVAKVPPLKMPNTTDAPICQAPRRLNPGMRHEVDKLTNIMLQAGLFSPSS